MNEEREQCLLIATIALECGRYLEVIEALRPIFSQKIELTSAERRLLGEAFQKIPIDLRFSMYSIHSLLKKAEEEDNKPRMNLIQNYYQKLEHEFRQRLKECSNIILEYLLPYTNNPEAQVHYLLMQIHYWMRLSDFARGPEQVSAISNTHALFKKAKGIADAHLKVTNLLVLKVILGYTTFLHARLDKPYEAATLGRQTYLAVVEHIDEVTEAEYSEISPLLRQIEDTYRHASHFVPDDTEETNRTVSST